MRSGLRIADCELATTELPPKEADPVEQSLGVQIDEWAMLVRMSLNPNVRDLLEGHISLELESIDRLYLNGYVPQLQHGAGLVGFLSRQRGQPIASPALLGQITEKFVAEVKAFAKEQGIPLFHFERNESKDRRAHQLRRERPVRDAVVFIGIAQEKAYAFSAHRLPSKRAVFEFTRNKSVLPNYYYFYLDDADWGESFIKVCSYAPGV
jgi:hypothetical protein